ncbi:hypothetical protein [Paenarthrobacter sp. NPDC018779]|uniref:hypothetical protein n=1 Tax=Paenarthrobacter sp. NPDC018779 TaxID=3364375 RepID=UPI0037C6686A
MEPGPQNLLELRRAGDAKPSGFLDLVAPQVGGGTFSPEDLSQIDAHPDATTLRISGLSQPAFERLVSSYGNQFTAIEFWKCPRIEDLTPIEDLSELRMVSFYWNQRCTHLWDLSRTPLLTALRVEDFNRLHRLDDLVAGHELKELILGDAVWDKTTFETLEPLAELTGLRRLSLLPKRIGDGRIQPLGKLTNLANLRIPFNMFTTEQIAWLRARLPETTKSEALNALLPLEKPFDIDGRSLDVLLIGKRKPWLNSEQNAARIAKHVSKFQDLVAEFRSDPTLDP